MRVACSSQDSSEWFTARIGKVTASCIADAIKFVWKGSKARNDKRLESSAVRNAYISELAWGMITRVPIEHYVSKAMDLGKEFEGDARRAYSIATEQMVDQTGFILHPTMDIMGSSPDGLVPEFKRGVELKVPQFRTHKELLETEQIPELWTLQCYCGMLCCEYDEWDFCSYLPPDDRFGYEAVSLPAEFRLFRKRFYRDEAAEELFRRMEDGAQQTIEDAIKKVEYLQRMYPRKGEPKSKFNVDLERSKEALEASEDILKDFDDLVMSMPYKGDAA